MIYIVKAQLSGQAWVTCGEFEDRELAFDHAFIMSLTNYPVQIVPVPIIEGN